MELAMKKVLITGGTRGIGRALAEALLQQGAEVLVCGANPESVERAKVELGVRAIVCDVTRASDRARLVSVVRGELGGLDLLVNNAGIQNEHDVSDGLDLAAVRHEVEVNLLAPIALVEALLPLLAASPQAVVANVTSALAIAPAPRAPVYAASKAALATFTKCLRAQLEQTAVRVVEIVPPLVATDMTVGRQAGAVAPQVVVDAVVAGLRAERERIVIGKARLLAFLHRISPGLADRTMRAR